MTTSNVYNKTLYGGRMHFPSASHTPQSNLPDGYMAHAHGSSFIVSMDHGFLRDRYGNIKIFATSLGMESYCKKHAAQGLRSDEVPV